MEVRKICQWCGKPFIAQKTTTCYCSHQCSNFGYKERIRERKRQLKRSQELLQPRQAAEGQDFFSFAQAAKLMGVTRQYIYKLVKESKLRASRISGKKSLIRRADIELMMKTKPYERVVPKEDFDISEYCTAEEIAEKYKVNAKWVWTYTRQHKVPKVRIRQFNYYSKKHIDAAFAKYEVDSDLTEWYTPEEIQEKYCVVILHFASGKLDLGKEKGQESIYKFAMENILAEAFTEKIKMENVICWEENKGTYLGILSEFSEKETKERAEQVRNIFEKYFPETLQIGYISPSVPFYEVGLEKEKIMEYDKTHIYDEGEIKEFMVLLREKEASGHILDEDYILQCLNKGFRVSTMEYLQKTLQHVKQTMHSVEGFRNFQVELTQLVSKYLHDKKENMNSVIRDPIYLRLDMNAVKSLRKESKVVQTKKQY